MLKRKSAKCLASLTIILLSVNTALFLSNNSTLANLKGEDTSPGGILVNLQSNPKPTITIDTSDLANKTYIPIKIWGVADNSATKWSSAATIPKCGLSFIADVDFAGASKSLNTDTDEALSAQSLRDNIENAFINNKSSFGMTLDEMPQAPVTIDNMNAFKVVNNQAGKPVLRVTLRGDSESGVTSMVLKYYTSGLPLNTVKNSITFSVNKKFLISDKGMTNDESPGKINTKGREIPAKGNNIIGTVNFYNYDQCYGSWGTWAFIELKSNAKASQVIQADVPTWSKYISPWDSEGEYNIDKASFNEVNGVESQLPGGYLTPVLQWNLKKDGQPTEELIAKRFGRVVNYFTKAVDKDVHVTAKGTKTPQGQDFVLSSDDTGVMERSVTIQTLYEAKAPSISPHSFGETTFSNRQTIPLEFGVTAPTSNEATLWEAVDDGEFKEIKTYDLSKDDPDDIAVKNADLPKIEKIGKHTLHFKLIDTNGLESKVKDLPVTIDQRELITKDSEIRQYNHWDKKDNISSVKNENGVPADFNLVQATGKVDTATVGDYPITLSYDGMTNTNKVSVLKSLSELKTKDITLTVGDQLDPEKAFISAKDNDGKPLTFKAVKVEGTDKVDTRRVGDYTLSYSLGDIAPITTKVTVHVKKGALSLSELPNIHFPNLQLDGKAHELTSDEKNLIIEDRRGKESAGWQLQAKYSGLTPDWDKSRFNLSMDLTTKDPALEIPQSPFSFSHEDQLVCEVPKSAIVNELLETKIDLLPRLQVPARVSLGISQAAISWNLIEAPEK